MLKKIFGFLKKSDEEEIPKISEPKPFKVELISNLISNTFKDNIDNKDKFDDKLSFVKDHKIKDIKQKIKIYFNKKEKIEFDAIIISKNSLLIDRSFRDYFIPEKIEILSLNKKYLIKTNLIEEGFVYIMPEKMLIISFFSNLFEKNLGIDGNKSNQEIQEENLINTDVKTDLFEAVPINFIKINVSSLYGYKNPENGLSFNENETNLILKGIYFGSLLINEKYKNLNVLNLNYAKCGSLGMEILIKTKIPNLKILKLQSSEMTSKSILLFKDNIFSNLTELDLSNNEIGNEIIENLEKSNLINLTKLNLSKTILNFMAEL